MDHSFSVDEVPSDAFWTAQPDQVTNGGDAVTCEAADTTTAGGDAATDGSPSDEWSFERFLEEELMLMDNTTTPVDSSGSPVLHVDPSVPEPATAATPGMAAGDPVEYNAMLKRKLEEDLAAIAMWRASATVHPEVSQGSYAHIGGIRNLPQKKFRGGGRLRVQNTYTSARLPASSSSMERSPSDDDDMDGEVEVLGFRIPDAEKLRRRKASNRESARRSRSRKAAHMKDLEDQVAHLRVENSLLLTRLDALNQKYKAAAVDKRVLRADMETLRTKVKMAEDTVNRLIATNPLHTTVVPNPPSFSNMPFVVGPPSHATPPEASSVPIQDNNSIINTNVYSTAAATDAMVSNTYMPMTAPLSPLQAEVGVVVNGSSDQIAASHCATAMELLEKRVMSDDMPTTSSGAEAAPLESAVEVANMEMH